MEFPIANQPIGIQEHGQMLHLSGESVVHAKLIAQQFLKSKDKRVGDLRVCGKPRPRSLDIDMYSVTSPSRFLRATLKAGRWG